MKRILPTLWAVAVGAGLLAVAEGALRIVGFEREIAPVTLRFGYPNPREIVGIFQFDPRLFWRLRPGSVFDAEGPVPINRLGYRGREPQEPAPQGLVRVAVLGDSVAFGAGTAWPERLEARLSDRLAPRPVEVLNFGVPGYTVVQGERQFEDEVARLHPTAVVVAYGWNDHWLARGGLPDDALPVPSRWRSILAIQLSRLRLAQALQALAGRLAGAPRGPAPGAGELLRVPLDRYARHLGEMIAQARAAGATPLVVGLPSALTERECPPYLLDGGFTRSARDAVADHARYAAAARETAEKAGAPFLDCQPAFSRDDEPDDSLFTRDRIHLSAAGHSRMSELIEASLLELLRERP